MKYSIILDETHRLTYRTEVFTLLNSLGILFISQYADTQL